MIAATSKTDICHVYFWPLPNVKNQPFIFPTTRWQEAFDTLMSGTACKIVVDAQTWDFGHTGTFAYLYIFIFAHSILVWALNIFFFNKYNFTTLRFEWKLEQTDLSVLLPFRLKYFENDSFLRDSRQLMDRKNRDTHCLLRTSYSRVHLCRCQLVAGGASHITGHRWQGMIKGFYLHAMHHKTFLEMVASPGIFLQ